MTETSKAQKLKLLSPDQIDPNPENPRLVFRQEEMETLLLSIHKHGIQVPITVFKEGERYVLIDGERRWRCAKKLALKAVPAIVRDKPSELENLVLMYNIHALREQWDYFTIASKLTRVIDLYEEEEGKRPSESTLSELTGLTRGAIRRCQLLLGLPDKYKELLLRELELPKSQQQLSEDFFIEMERALKAVSRRLPEYEPRVDAIRQVLIEKFRGGLIEAITDFRQLSKIATAVDSLGLRRKVAINALEKVFDRRSQVGIRQVYAGTVQFEYEEQKASKQIDTLVSFVEEIISDGRFKELDDDILAKLRHLYSQLRALLRPAKK